MLKQKRVRGYRRETEGGCHLLSEETWPFRRGYDFSTALNRSQATRGEMRQEIDTACGGGARLFKKNKFERQNKCGRGDRKRGGGIVEGMEKKETGDCEREEGPRLNIQKAIGGGL